MKNRIHIYRVGQPVEVRDVEFKVPAGTTYDDGPGYDQLKTLLNPLLDGELEHVSVLWNGKPADMFVHDEGRIIGLPRNDEATAIYRAFWLSKHPDHDPETLNTIHGTAILFDRRVWF